MHDDTDRYVIVVQPQSADPDFHPAVFFTRREAYAFLRDHIDPELCGYVVAYPAALALLRGDARDDMRDAETMLAPFVHAELCWRLYGAAPLTPAERVRAFGDSMRAVVDSMTEDLNVTSSTDGRSNT